MNPKILSIGTAVPRPYPQEEIFQEMGYASHFRKIFLDSGIETRHFWVPLTEIRHLSWQEQQDRYREGALQLSKRAILDCLDGSAPEGVRCLVFNSCTGILPGPTMPHYLGKELSLPHDTYYLNIGGMGCEGGFPGLKRAYDFVKASPEDIRAVAVATELSSCSYFPEGDTPDPENHYELLRSNAIFADASAAVLVGYDRDPRHPEIIDTATYTDTRYIDELGYIWRDGRLRVKLGRDIPKIAGSLVPDVLAEILHQNDIDTADIKHWVIHAAGVAVLQQIQRTLNLKDEQLQGSYEVLRENGNCSSATIGLIGQHLMRNENPEGYGLVVSLGPGMTAGATLLKWG